MKLERYILVPINYFDSFDELNRIFWNYGEFEITTLNLECSNYLCHSCLEEKKKESSL